MRLLAVGDVCGPAGCEEIKRVLPRLKRDKRIDLTVVNGENSAFGNGITPESADFLFACGADVITGGNHSLRRKQIFPYLEEKAFLLRPHNLPEAECGSVYCLVDMCFALAAVINLSGKIYLEKLNASSPFDAAAELITRAESDGAKIIAVDFHAEATSEKRALGLYLDGRVSAFFGTHTHVQTADEQILKNGTGYITDLGMTGPVNSVLGVKSNIIINRLRLNDMSKFEFEDGRSMLCGCVFDIDENTGKTTAAERICIK